MTAVCSAANAGLARDLGATQVIDYRSQAIVGTYDVILDVIGTLPWARAKAHLAKDGTLCLISADLMQNIGAKFRPRRSNGRRIVASITGERPDKMARLLDLYRKGTYRPVLGAVFRFADIRKAHKLVEGFSKPGTVILEMGQP